MSLQTYVIQHHPDSSSWVSRLHPPTRGYGQYAETTHLSPVSPKTPSHLERAKASSSFLPLPVTYTLYRCPFSTWISAVNWKPWETSPQLIFTFSSLTVSPRRSSHPKEKGIFYLTSSKNLWPLYHPLTLSQISKCPSSLQLQSPSSC